MPKPKRDPNAPKRNLSAYLLYQNAMRDQFRALNPGMSFGQLSKYTSAMYAEMPPAEKEAWIARAEADKERYLQELTLYAPPPGYDEKGDLIITNPGNETVTPRTAKSGKAERDVNAPKRNLSAYLLYQNAMRDEFKRENPGMTFGQLSKYTSCMYKLLSPEEKASWVTRAEQDKLRYEKELEDYTPPPGHDARGNLIEEHRPRKRNKRPQKDPFAPKRASGAYVFFTNEMRPMVMKQFPGIKFVEMGRILGERWRALTPEEKARYEKLAQEDKVRFQLEMQQYTANQALQQQQQQVFTQAQAAAAVGAPVGPPPPNMMPVHPSAHSQYHGVQAPNMAPPPPPPPHNQQMYMDPHQVYYPNDYDPTKFPVTSQQQYH